MQQSISEFMFKDHENIERIYKRFKAELNKPEKDFDELLKTFKNFKWAFERHIFTEEKAIFISVKDNNEIFKLVEDIINEHIILTKELKNIENNLEISNIPLLETFETLLEKHKKFEDEILYPKFEELLDDTQKHEIFNRIKESIAYDKKPELS